MRARVAFKNDYRPFTINYALERQKGTKRGGRKISRGKEIFLPITGPGTRWSRFESVSRVSSAGRLLAAPARDCRQETRAAS